MAELDIEGGMRNMREARERAEKETMPLRSEPTTWKAEAEKWREDAKAWKKLAIRVNRDLADAEMDVEKWKRDAEWYKEDARISGLALRGVMRALERDGVVLRLKPDGYEVEKKMIIEGGDK